LGWCGGGTTALIVASKAVDRVDKVVVWSCNAYVNTKDIDYYKKIRDVQTWPQYLKQSHIEMYGEKYFSETWEAWVDGNEALLETNDGDICRKVLPEINTPTLIMHGLLDKLIPIEHAIYLHENIKNSL